MALSSLLNQIMIEIFNAWTRGQILSLRFALVGDVTISSMIVHRTLMLAIRDAMLFSGLLNVVVRLPCTNYST